MRIYWFILNQDCLSKISALCTLNSSYTFRHKIIQSTLVLCYPFWKVLFIRTKIAHSRNELVPFLLTLHFYVNNLNKLPVYTSTLSVNIQYYFKESLYFDANSNRLRSTKAGPPPYSHFCHYGLVYQKWKLAFE